MAKLNSEIEIVDRDFDVARHEEDVNMIDLNIADMYKCVVMKCATLADVSYCINCASKFAVEDLARVILKSNHQLFSIAHGFDMPNLDGQTQCNDCDAELFKLCDSTKCDECFNTVLSLFNYGVNNGYVILST
ncbi:hypothetical protein [Chrysodeixis includens nucleopolyhedrovirus]|uniref:Uncharacterized protein n=2 Tax=Alphabaculovirus TaxID=558016 RepID=A0A1C8ZYB1_9ABAC|nr:hypothetical protein [Chrysodeixis includens nucleopolyhedrovirus]AOL56827.1 hypothetical protein [Chrysodeixis includens nucleopolyhedrovirus]AOL56969.1 hypothetical protein [Chrysodeixis includens nucleopolyhedrovirus]QBI90329.1 hypothetical protein [Trichoplusia ni single nucleopolyhedrovirus]